MSERQTTSPGGVSRKRVAAVAALFLLVATAVGLTIKSGSAPFVLFAGIVLATALRPAVEAVCTCRVPRWAAALLVFIAFLGAATGALLLILPLVAEQLSAVAAKLPGYYRDLREAMRGSSTVLVRQLGAQLPPSTAALGGRPQSVVKVVEHGAATLEALPQILLAGVGVLVVAYYWCVERPVLVRVMTLATRIDKRSELRAFFDAAEVRVGAYVRGQLVVCVIVGVLASIAYALIGLPYALLLGSIAAIMEIVPFIGPALGAAPALAVALSVDPISAVWVMIAAGSIQLVENYVLAPRVLGRSVGVSAFALILAVVAFTSLFGAPGAILGIPMAAVLQLATERFVVAPKLARVAPPDGRDATSAIAYEAGEVALAARRLLAEREYAARSMNATVVEEIEALAEGIARVAAGAEAPPVAPAEPAEAPPPTVGAAAPAGGRA